MKALKRTAIILLYVLAAMGYEFEGDRLGLGTNLFSGVPTLAETNGWDWMHQEFCKYSYYYMKNFT